MRSRLLFNSRFCRIALLTVLATLTAPPRAAQSAESPARPLGVMQYLGQRASRMAAGLPAIPGDRGAWQTRRETVRRELSAMLGLPERELMRAKVMATRVEGDLVVEDVLYLWAERAYVSANVVRPKEAARPLPALVVPPGWLGQLNQSAYYTPFVYRKARDGYVVLFIDDPHVGVRAAPCAGLYAAAAAAGTQVMGIQVFDALRGLDYLLTRPDVDPQRIGVAGLCQGSEQTWLAAALEDRFQIAVPVCGTTTYEGWVRMPAFEKVDLSDPSPYVGDVLRCTDWHEIGACIAPRPVYIASNSGDNWWPVAGYDKVTRAMNKVYALYGKPDSFRHLRDLRSHSMTPYIPELAPWIDSHLQARPAGEDIKPQPCLEPIDPDTSMLRYAQRRIARRVEALPAKFASAGAWDEYRKSLLAWLAEACDLGGMKSAPAVQISRAELAGGIAMEVVELPVVEDFRVPATVLMRPAPATKVGWDSVPTPSGQGPDRQAVRRPAVILSHDHFQSMQHSAVTALALTLANEGYVVCIPEHASRDKNSRRAIGNVSSLYGASDAVGLPPLAMRVWDDLRALEYLVERPDVDPLRIAVVGLGVGGVDAAIAAAVETRIAGCAVQGATTVRDWGEVTAPQLNTFDHIMPYLPNITRRTDWQYVYAAVAPRPLLLVDRPTDRVQWPASGYERVKQMAVAVYTLVGKPENLCTPSAKNDYELEDLQHWLGGALAPAAGQRSVAVAAPVFTPEEVATYRPKGPTQCFRQICLEYNSPPRFDKAAGLYGKPEAVAEYFSAADPVAYAEFCDRIHLDAALLLAVPEGGYTTYRQTRVGIPYPGMHGDWFGETVRELHRRKISALGYCIVGWNDLDRDRHPERWFANNIPCLNGPYGELLLAYSRELLTHYPIDGIRYDILDHASACRCLACRAFYRELYAEDMPIQYPNWQREQRFRIASIGRFIRRCYETKQAIKPSVEIWQNWFSLSNAADLRDSRYVDIAYEEFSTPADTLILQGIFGSRAMISGKLLQNPDRRLCLALGGRAYDYFPVSKKTALPSDNYFNWIRKEMAFYAGNTAPNMAWFENDLAPFYAMVAEIEPYLRGARPVAPLGVVYCEASRYRNLGFQRTPLVDPLKKLAAQLLRRSIVPRFMSSVHLPQADLSPFRLLVVPDASGMQPEEMRCLTEFARGGGRVLLTGRATLYDENGELLPDFAQAEELGLRLVRLKSPEPVPKWVWRNTDMQGARATLDVPQAGQRTLHLWMRESNVRIDQCVLTADPDFLPPGNKAVTSPTERLLVVEAEATDRRTPREGRAWSTAAAIAGFHGPGYLQSHGPPFMTPQGFESHSAEAAVKVVFPQPGKYCLWVRFFADNGSSDSVFAGLDGRGQVVMDLDAVNAHKHPVAEDERLAVEPLPAWTGKPLPSDLPPQTVVLTRPVDGETWVRCRDESGCYPLVHMRPLGAGQIVYLAAPQALEIVTPVIDRLLGPPPLTVHPSDKQAILTRQDAEKRWILHLMSDGDYAVEIRAESARPTRVAAQFPAAGWTCSFGRTTTGVRIEVSGAAKDRLLVLE